MSLIVQKFGGSSVKDAAHIRNVAGIIAETYLQGNDVMVVLSAQGDTTDDLIAKAEEINPRASKREMDMLLATGEQISVALCAMALEAMGLPCVSLTAWQVGIISSHVHSDARIRKIDQERVRKDIAMAEAERKAVEAQTAAQMKIIGAQGDAEVVRIKAQAEAEAMKAKAFVIFCSLWLLFS